MQSEMMHCDVCHQVTEHEGKELPLVVMQGGRLRTHQWVCCNKEDHSKIKEETEGMDTLQKHRYFNPPPEGWEYVFHARVGTRACTVRSFEKNILGRFEVRNEKHFDVEHVRFTGTTFDTYPATHAAWAPSRKIEVHDLDLVWLDSVELRDGMGYDPLAVDVEVYPKTQEAWDHHLKSQREEDLKWKYPNGIVPGIQG